MGHEDIRRIFAPEGKFKGDMKAWRRKKAGEDAYREKHIPPPTLQEKIAETHANHAASQHSPTPESPFDQLGQLLRNRASFLKSQQEE